MWIDPRSGCPYDVGPDGRTFWVPVRPQQAPMFVVRPRPRSYVLRRIVASMMTVNGVLAIPHLWSGADVPEFAVFLTVWFAIVILLFRSIPESKDPSSR